MRRLESLIPNQPVLDIQDDDAPTIYLSNDTQLDESNAVVEEQDEIPPRMFTDSEVVGYSDIQTQIDTYRLVTGGNIPLSGDLSVCEIGAKRGDLARFISETNPGINLTYTGYETNDLLVTVGNMIFESEKLTQSSLLHIDVMDSGDIEDADIYMVISSLIFSPTITDSNKWGYCEKLLRKIIPHAKERVILLSLHDNGNDENYTSMPIPNMTELLLKFNHPFKIDFGRIGDMYMTVIDTTLKRFI